ncbi:unnamed protein product [Urochloa humidicola]
MLFICRMDVDLGSELPDISHWEIGTGNSVELSIEEPADSESLANPNPSNEHVGVDDECLYIDIGPEHQAPPIPTSHSDDEIEEDEVDESLSDDEIEEDDIVTDREPAKKPDAEYAKNDPPMAVGTMYSDMNAFKLTLATHATKYEFQYNIEKSDKSRYRVYCSGKNLGFRWRIHASTLSDKVTVKITRNPYLHENCHSTRRAGTCVGVTQFWVCEQVLDWLKEDGTLRTKELRRRLKEKHKIDVTYRKVDLGKQLAMDKLYGPWAQSFDNLYRFKAQIEETSPGSFVVIDHQTINNKIRFNRLFFALKACVDGFLRGCRPYLTVDSIFLNGRFRGPNPPRPRHAPDPTTSFLVGLSQHKARLQLKANYAESELDL